MPEQKSKTVKVTDTWYRISTPGKDDQVAKAGSAAHEKAAQDRSPGRPQVVKVISPGVYPQARIAALGLHADATKSKEKDADKAQPKGADKGAGAKDT